LAVAGLRHEAVDDAVKRHIVVKAVAGELFHALGMMRRDVVAQLNDDAPFGGVENERVLRIDADGERRRRGGGWCCTHDGE
jgi:hypothetical protein